MLTSEMVEIKEPSDKISKSEMARYKSSIKGLGHFQVCKLVMYHNLDHPYFIAGTPLYKLFHKKFHEFGGLTKEMRDRIGDISTDKN